MVGIEGFRAQNFQGRIKIVADALVDGHQCWLGRAISIMTGTRQAENKMVYDAFAQSLQDGVGEDFAHEFRENIANERKKLTGVTVRQVLTAADMRQRTSGAAPVRHEAEVSEKAALEAAANDRKVRFTDEMLEGPMTLFGRGRVNQVWLARYELPDGSQFSGIYKKEPLYAEIGGFDVMGINPSEARISERNVATYRLNQLLGLNVIPVTEFATHQGEQGDERGIVMGLP